MPQPFSNQVPTAPETRPATLVSQDEAQDEEEISVLSTPPHHGHGIPSNEPLPAASSGVAPSHKISTTENFKKAPAQLASDIHELDIGSGQIYKPHIDANPDLGDLSPGQCSGPYANTSTSPLGIWDISKDVPASSVLEKWTEEDLLKFGIHEGIDANHGLPPFDENVREYYTAKTASSKRKSDDGIHDSTESYGGINVTFGLPPWIETKFSETGETLEKNSNQYHFGAPFVQVSGLSPTPPRKDTDCKALRSVSLSAVGTPTVAESRTLPLAETKDTAATGDTDIDFPCSRKIPSASERPESSFALRDVSVIPWTDCYPDDPDKARELATSTGVPGLQIYSVDIFTHATSDTQVLGEVDATQDSHNFRVEMEPQPNDSVRASSVTDSERADESDWVKVEIETENPDQTDNV
ncbi:uncharacterized protein MAM_01271 [Metarhizium album ARSEF 1941]|uniref:Uncharacterized protein n=1 Tax=Metarhizium album (strain ARSEF 1941) TaxID=1081103 RepID=A0A0B2X410_METAS|nr:uncharacterized protein MAM_01271 [Metarhizium album ARSEF 1941]KHO00493.1 hypothetical protein MAM_01271 [Metarhizium album ARSEF 1941]